MKEYDIFQKDIYATEIWQASRCLDHEESINQAIGHVLVEQGFDKTNNPKIWKRGQQTAMICLVDDIRSLSSDHHSDLPYLYDRDTIVITDNYVNCPAQYRVVRMPESFFGIYSYQPRPRTWSPDRNFTFSVNRIDVRRMLLMLELGWRQHLDKGYVNFNCLKRRAGSPDNSNSEQGPAVWHHMWEFDLSISQREQYQRSYDLISQRMPVLNYDCSHDDIHTQSYINIVVESYSGDNNITVSEKIIRALVTPSPWTVYAGRYTVAYLESLGFDCLHDIVDHNHYDRLKEVEDKIHLFVWNSLDAMKKIRAGDQDHIRQRCDQASQHNIRLLASMRENWSNDFGRWIRDLPNQLSRRPTVE